MLSSDRNIETIGQLVEAIKHYIGLQSKYVKLDVMEKIVRLMGAFVLALVLSVLLIITLIYASFAAVYAMAPSIGLAAAFGVVSAVYLVVLILCVVFRKRWIERPLVKFLATLLMQE